MKQSKGKTVIVVLGPTGVGKTYISIHLAQLFNCPIISSDSRQFYGELKIGTAVPSEEQLKIVKHYFIGSHSIFDKYNAGQFEIDVLQLLDQLFEKNNTVLLVGGSMMYIDAVCNGMDNIPEISAETRLKWTEIYKDKGLEYCQEELKKLDPDHYKIVNLKNPKRVLHALEVCTESGKTYTEFRKGVRKIRPFNIVKIGLNRTRTELYERINYRVDEMLNDGLLSEAEPFYKYRTLNTLNTVGYKEVYQYMDGKISYESAVEMIKQNTRRYAKRQLTWFGKDSEITWFHPDQEEEILNHLKKIL